MDECLRKSCRLYFLFSSGGHFVQLSETVRAKLVEGIMRKISVSLFEFGLVVKEISFELFKHWWPFCSAEQNSVAKDGSALYFLGTFL